MTEQKLWIVVLKSQMAPKRICLELINNKEEWDKLVTYIEETEPTKDTPQPPDASLAKNEEAAGMLLKCEADEYALLIGQLKSEGVISSKSMGLFTKAKQGFT